MTDFARLTPRSAVAVTDTALLRAARTELDTPDTATAPTLAARLRELAALLPHRSDDARAGVVRLDRSGD